MTQSEEIGSTRGRADPSHRQLAADMAAGGQGCAPEEAILLRGLPRLHPVRSHDR